MQSRDVPVQRLRSIAVNSVAAVHRDPMTADDYKNHDVAECEDGLFAEDDMPF
jgi:hypothetical protein